MSEITQAGEGLSGQEIDQLVKKGDRNSQKGLVGVHILLIIGGIFMVFPFVYQVLMSLSTNAEIQAVPPKFIPDEWQFKNYADVFTRFMSLPVELEEAARLDGCNPWQTFWRVMVPVVKPGLFAVMITTVLWSWNDLLWPLIVTTREESMPLSVGIATLAGQHSSEFALMMAASVMAMAPIFLLFFSMQKRVIEGLASSGLKG